MSGHTPGPWLRGFWGDDGSGRYIEAPTNSGSGPVAVVCHLRPEGKRLDEESANALLIAAAPELLAALKELVDTHHMREGEENIARAAIAKAEGR